MNRLVLKKGRVIDPAQALDGIHDVYVADGKILGITKAPLGFTADHTIDCAGKIICPGFIDCGVNVTTSDPESDATLASETLAAVANGITTLVCRSDKPVIDSTWATEAMMARAKHVNAAKVFFLGALTENFDGKQLACMASLKKAGCVGVTQNNHPIHTTALLRHCFEYAATFDMPVLLQALNHSLAAGGVVHEGEVSVRLGLPGIPSTAESIAVSEALLLQEETGVRLHFSCITSGVSIALLTAARQRGISVTADVALSHLYLTEWDTDGFNALCHTAPPLRSVADQEALLRGIESGVITSVCSNHTPLSIQAKSAPFPSTLPGISGLDTLVPLLFGLEHKTTCSLSDLIRLVTQAPANLIGLSAGTLHTDAPADLCVVDPTVSFVLTEAMLRSHGKNTPFIGSPMQGKVILTLVDGKIVYNSPL